MKRYLRSGPGRLLSLSAFCFLTGAGIAALVGSSVVLAATTVLAISILPMTIGLFAIPEMLYMASKGTGISDMPLGDLSSGRRQGIRDAFENWWLILRCSFIGVWVGIIPGLGSSVADWFAYGHAKQTCPGARETFGTGDVRGVIGVDAASRCMLKRKRCPSAEMS